MCSICIFSHVEHGVVCVAARSVFIPSTLQGGTNLRIQVKIDVDVWSFVSGLRCKKIVERVEAITRLVYR